jgi:Transglutaminase-like superfamily
VKLRSTLGWSILALWVAVLGLHVKREYFRPEGERLAAGAKTLAPGAHFFVVRMNGRAIGTATTRLDTLPDGFFFQDDLLLDVPAMDTVHRAATMSRLRLDPSLGMRSFVFRLESGIGTFAVDGTAMPDSTLDISVEAGGSKQHSRIPMEGGVILDGAVAMRLAAAGRLVPGTEVTVRTFDPSALSARDVTVRVTATDTLILPDSAAVHDGRWKATVWDTIPVWRVEQKFGGISLASWVDEDGLLVRAESPLGFDVERTTYELARQEWSDARGDASLTSGYGALIEGTAISSNVDLSKIESTQSLRLRLKGVELEGFDLSGGRQTLHGDTLVVTREDPAMYASAGYSLPYNSGGEASAELESTPLIQADDPRIREKAVEVTQGTRNPSVAALRLSAWIYATLRKEITPSIPSAIQVLDALRGDCNEHTVLYVAMARSIGLPARTAVGLVSVRGRFYYHAWPEVWLAGQWVAFDPTLGQNPADASHLRFLVGGLARQVELIRLIGRLEIEAQ